MNTESMSQNNFVSSIFELNPSDTSHKEMVH